ncbi:MAG: hypothetical protein NVSMB9_34900 [Isosphaeraceae bacterium]
MQRIFVLPALLCLAMVLTNAHAARACPNCKEAVAAQPSEVASTARGYNWSVLFMLAMPFTLLSSGALMMARAVKRGDMPEF